MSVEVPHLAWPARIDEGHLAVVEQDTWPDVAQCVQVIANTPLGSAGWDSELGMPGQLFSEGGADPDELVEAVTRSESRAEVQVSRVSDVQELAQNTDRLAVKLRVREEG